jgi:hypothetical protein
LNTLKEYDIDQIKKAKTFETILSLMKKNSINIDILIDNSLHGKVYLFKKENEIFTGILTSANFTDNGLENNHEYGIEIKNKNELDELYRMVFYNKSNIKLTMNQIKRIIEKSNKYRDENGLKEKTKININLNLIKDIGNNKDFLYFTDGNYWLKPIGTSEGKMEEGEEFNNLEERLNFSVRPAGIRKGDIIIVYGVGPEKILSVYNVNSSEIISAVAKEIKKENWREQYSWSVMGKNLTIKYGGQWWEHNINIFEQHKRFIEKYPDENITFVGGQNLNGMKYRRDKLKLGKRFAEYVITKVMEIEKSL